jgi:Ca-activated chloride channel homolog
MMRRPLLLAWLVLPLTFAACAERDEAPTAQSKPASGEGEGDEKRSASVNAEAAATATASPEAPSPRIGLRPSSGGARPPAKTAPSIDGVDGQGSRDEDTKSLATASPPPPPRPDASSKEAGPGGTQSGRGLAGDTPDDKGKHGTFNGMDKSDVNPGVLAESSLPPDMMFQHYGVNPTIDTEEEPRSTFAIDVDTASYTMTRAFLERGTLPAEAAVRVEEIVNAFDYGYEAPVEETFSVHAEAAPSPNRKGYHLLHVGLKGRDLQTTGRQDANLVFVVDVSGSMAADNRLGLVKRSLHMLVDQLHQSDSVGIVAFGTTARIALEPTGAGQRERIAAAIDGLKTEGSTNAEAGLRMGYRLADEHFRQGAVNRVVLCSDGVANVGITGPNGLLAIIDNERKHGITISTVGFGMGNYNDVLMEQLADKGDGNYYYVDALDQARHVFVEELAGTVQVIAKDVKVQVEFDPQVVARYRLLGYENRALAAESFNDDRVDAGEVGAGHSVTAIYEIKLRSETATGPLGAIGVRFKDPSGGASRLLKKDLPRSIVHMETGEMSSAARLGLIAAQFAEKLRGSYWARNVAYDDILRHFEALAPALRQRADVVELHRLVEEARALDKRGDKFAAEAGPVARMDFDRIPVLQ